MAELELTAHPHTALLAACAASPDDDAPRLVWADAVGGERGELVVIQCDLARGGLAPGEVAARRRRERALIAEHGATWSGLAGLATRCTFDRGFVDAAEIEVTTFLERADEIRDRAPLFRALTATGLSGHRDLTTDGIRRGPDTLPLLARLIAHPGFRELHGLDIRDPFVLVQNPPDDPLDSGIGHEWLGDDVVALLASTGALAGLRAFGLRDGLTRRWEPLIEARAFAHLERLWLGDGVTNALVQPLLEQLAVITDLELATFPRVGHILPFLPPTLRALRVNGIDDATLTALAASPCAPGLERLSLHDGGIIDAASRFVRFPCLRVLDFGAFSIGQPGASMPETRRAALAALGAAPPPMLRELSGITAFDPPSLRVLIDALGPQLERLDLRTWEAQPALEAELATLMAGELIIRTWSKHVPLLHVGPPRSPGHPIVELGA